MCLFPSWSINKVFFLSFFLSRLHVSSAYIFGVQQLILQIQEFLSRKSILTFQTVKSILDKRILNWVENQLHHYMMLMLQHLEGNHCLRMNWAKMQLRKTQLQILRWKIHHLVFCWFALHVHLFAIAVVQVTNPLHSKWAKKECSIAVCVKLRCVVALGNQQNSF